MFIHPYYQDGGVLKDRKGGDNTYEQTYRLVHTMEKSKHAFEVVVQRRKTQGQMELDVGDTSDDSIIKGEYIYRAIATNSKRSNSDLVHWYNQRGDDSENRIKELKADFGGQKVPCRDFDANALFFSLCALAHNLFALLKVALPSPLQNSRIKRVRLLLYGVAAKLTRHSRTMVLKVGECGIELLNETLRNIKRMELYT